jgi:ACR3 family arsenite efflux pump ArsB
VQVSVNDLIMLLLFLPIVQFLVHGASSLTVPFNVLPTLVLIFAFQADNITGPVFQCWADSRSDHAPGLFQRGACLRPHEVAHQI